MVGEAVHAGHERGGRRLLVGVEVVLGVHQVGGRARVRADQQLLVGPGPQVLAQMGRDVVGAAVDQVVRRHHPGHRTRLDRRAERPQVVLVQHPRAHRGGGDVPAGLVVVRQPVLEHRGRAPVHRVVAAQAPGVGGGDRRGQQGVLGVALLVAAPQRVAQQVDRGRPDVQAHPLVAGAHRPDLPGHRLAHPAHQLRVPRRAEPHRLREHRGGAHPRHPVQGLLAGAERGDAQTLHGRGELVQEGDLLVAGQPRQQVVDALRERQPQIAERRRGRRGCGHVGFPFALERGRAFEALRCSFDDRAGVKTSCATNRSGPPTAQAAQEGGQLPGLAEESWKRPLCAPGLHLTSLHIEALRLTRRRGTRSPKAASAQPVPLETPQPTATAGCPGAPRRHEGLTQ